MDILGKGISPLKVDKLNETTSLESHLQETQSQLKGVEHVGLSSHKQRMSTMDENILLISHAKKIGRIV